MGPHFFKCGKKNRAEISSTIDALLQWGRTFSSAEKNPTGAEWGWRLNLQWGRTFSSAEKSSRERRGIMELLVFNGAALFQVRKTRTPIRCRQRTLDLQWGRTFSSAEKRAMNDQDKIKKLLQWGRTFSSAEKMVVMKTKLSAKPPFNGAALFQVRKNLREHID